MTGWNVLDSIIKAFPPLVAGMFFVTAGVIFAIGFFRYGVNFVKYGFKQMVLDSSIEKRFDDLGASINGLRTEMRSEISGVRSDMDGLRTELRSEISGVRSDMDGLRSDMDGLRSDMDNLRSDMDGLRSEVDGVRTELGMIKDNHFGHLKNFLTELTSIMLDKTIISNQDKARLDNQLRGM